MTTNLICISRDIIHISRDLINISVTGTSQDSPLGFFMFMYKHLRQPGTSQNIPNVYMYESPDNYTQTSDIRLIGCVYYTNSLIVLKKRQNTLYEIISFLLIILLT